jgi:hypothetical protein
MKEKTTIIKQIIQRKWYPLMRSGLSLEQASEVTFRATVENMEQFVNYGQ